MEQEKKHRRHFEPEFKLVSNGKRPLAEVTRELGVLLDRFSLRPAVFAVIPSMPRVKKDSASLQCRAVRGDNGVHRRGGCPFAWLVVIHGRRAAGEEREQ